MYVPVTPLPDFTSASDAESALDLWHLSSPTIPRNQTIIDSKSVNMSSKKQNYLIEMVVVVVISSFSDGEIDQQARINR